MFEMSVLGRVDVRHINAWHIKSCVGEPEETSWTQGLDNIVVAARNVNTA